MKKALLFCIGLMSVVLAVGAHPASARVNVDVNVNLGPPAIVVEQPPEMVVVPHSMIYFAPGVSGDLFFHDGWWWTRNESRWFRSSGYRGPWDYVPMQRVPRGLIGVPRDYRSVYGRERHVPYGQLKKHWRDREIERRERRGEWRDWKEEKREQKQEKREQKQEKREQKQEKREQKQERKDWKHGRGEGRDDRGRDDRGPGRGHGRDND